VARFFFYNLYKLAVLLAA